MKAVISKRTENVHDKHDYEARPHPTVVVLWFARRPRLSKRDARQDNQRTIIAEAVMHRTYNRLKGNITPNGSKRKARTGA